MKPKRFLSALEAADLRLAGAERALVFALLLAMVGLSFLQVMLRALFSGGLLWADTFLRHLVLWVGFLGAALAQGSEKQFSIDLAGRLLQGRARLATALIRELFSAAVCALLARASWRFFLEEYKSGAILFSVGGLHVQGWVFELILPLGFALVGLHALIRALRVAAGADAPGDRP